MGDTTMACPQGNTKLPYVSTLKGKLEFYTVMIKLTSGACIGPISGEIPLCEGWCKALSPSASCPTLTYLCAVGYRAHCHNRRMA